MPRKKLDVASVSQPIKEEEKSIQGRFYKELVERVRLFRDGEILLAAVPDGKALQVWRLDSKENQRYLQSLFYELYQRPMNQAMLVDAKAMLEMLAAKKGTPCKVGLRVLRREGAVYLDMCNGDWEVIAVTAHGVQVMQPQEPLFYRRGDMQPLPPPQSGGDWGEFWSFLNIPQESHRLLVRAWLVTTLMADMNVPLLVLVGEQGSAKSTTSRILRMLIDPHRHLLHNMPASEHELFVSAQGHAVLVFDNMTRVTVAMSNALCKLITGSSYVTRKLYHDNEEVCLEAKRALIINGIDDLVEKQDLISRTVMIHLPSIPEAAMQTEMLFNRRLRAAHPRMLRLILADVQIVLSLLPLMPEAGFSSRMADYTRVGMALAEGIGLGREAFEQAFSENRLFATETGLDAEPVAEALMRFLKRYPYFKGTASELLTHLGGMADDYMRVSNRWPKQPNYLIQILNQIAPALRQRGVLVEFGRTSDKRWVRVIKKEIMQNTVMTVINGKEAVGSASQAVNQAVPQPFGQYVRDDDEPLKQPLPSPVPTVNFNGSATDDGDDDNRSNIIW